MPRNRWVKVPDKIVKHIWECPVCHDKERVSPDAYEEMGTPVCSECDEDMTYSHTEIFARRDTCRIK